MLNCVNLRKSHVFFFGVGINAIIFEDDQQFVADLELDSALPVFDVSISKRREKH